MKTMKKAAFFTLGCKVNQYDTQAVIGMLADAGFEIVDFKEPADIYFINTCTVTATSDKKSRQMIARAHAQSPDAPIVVMGCYSQRAPETITELPGVRLVMGTGNKENILELINKISNEEKPVNAVSLHDDKTRFPRTRAELSSRIRAYLKIQDGCDRFCSYCIIPHVRGPIKSRNIGDIESELIRLEREGYKEIVLTGIHLMSYGRDIDSSIIDVLNIIKKLPGIGRIRLGSLEPYNITDETIAALADTDKLCRHFHMSLQSGSKSVLNRMNRRYTPDMFADYVYKLRSKMPDCAITTDIIAGFPGETEAEFNETLEFINHIKFSRIHAFPYSKRSGTAAAAIKEQLPNAIKQQRTKALIELGNVLEAEFMAGLIGKAVPVLFETEKNSYCEGYTDSYARVQAKADPDAIGCIKNVFIKSADNGKLIGTLI